MKKVISLLFLLSSCWIGLEPVKEDNPVKAICTMESSGKGYCAFTNMGSTVVSTCGKIRLYRTGTDESVYSEMFCSDNMKPQSSVKTPFFVPSVDILCSHREAGAKFRWTTYCKLEFIEIGTNYFNDRL